jgi:hypothetical protein
MPNKLEQKEKTIVIENREQLSFMLCEAATLEHMVMCGYLYAIFTLKQSTEEGLTESQLSALKRWERIIAGVAEQEMLHLALANNLLTSIGTAPYFGRPNFPHPARYFSQDVQLTLLPFGEKALRHFLYLERPEGMSLKTFFTSKGKEETAKVLTGEEIVPEKQSFSTVGHLYRGIEQGFWDLCDKYGESQVFVGSAEAQATEEYFGWPELIAVTDLKGAMKAINTIVTEGEGARGDWRNAHFGKFFQVLEEYLEFKRKDKKFDPARPAIPAYVRLPSDVEQAELITDPSSAGVENLFNGCYEVLLQMLSRFFIQIQTLDKNEREILSNSSVGMMIKVINPLGKLLTRMPLGSHRPKFTVGPTFEIYQRNYLLPDKRSAWIIMRERLLEISNYSAILRKQKPEIQPDLARVERDLQTIAASFESQVKSKDRK